MDDNLKNEMDKIMGDAQSGVANDAVTEMAKLVATFYKSLVDNGVPKVVAITLTSSFISTVVGKDMA